MTELEIEEQERKVTGSYSVIEEARSVKVLPDHVGEDVRNILPEIESEDCQVIAIVMEITEEG